MQIRKFVRPAAVMSSLTAALSLTAVMAPPASAGFPNPDDGLTYHWTETTSWTPSDTRANCSFRNGWAVVDSDTLRFKYQLTCDTKAISLGSEVYIERGTTTVLNRDNTRICYDAKFCTTTYNFTNPGGSQNWKSTVRWNWQRADVMSPWLTQRFSK